MLQKTDPKKAKSKVTVFEVDTAFFCKATRGEQQRY
jgi:hypothetical protein